MLLDDARMIQIDIRDHLVVVQLLGLPSTDQLGRQAGRYCRSSFLLLFDSFADCVSLRGITLDGARPGSSLVLAETDATEDHLV